MTKTFFTAGAFAIGVLAAWPHAQQPPAAPQQPTDVVTTITSDGGAAPRLAVPDFIALTKDAETVAIAKQIGQVLWDDLAFESTRHALRAYASCVGLDLGIRD